MNKQNFSYVNKRKKFLYGILAFVLVVGVAGAAVGITLAAVMANVSASINVTYIAKNVKATITGEYTTGKNIQESAPAISLGDAIVFSGKETGKDAEKSFKNIDMINLADENDYAEFHYTIQNDGEYGFGVTLELSQTQQDPSNMVITYSSANWDGTSTKPEYDFSKDSLGALYVEAKGTQSSVLEIGVKMTIDDVLKNANISGTFTFTLDSQIADTNSYVFTFNTSDKLDLQKKTILEEDISSFDPTAAFNSQTSAFKDDIYSSSYFGGWYLDEDYETEYSLPALTQKYQAGKGIPVTLYAKWVDKTTPRLSINSASTANGMVDLQMEQTYSVVGENINVEDATLDNDSNISLYLPEGTVFNYSIHCLNTDITSMTSQVKLTSESGTLPSDYLVDTKKVSDTDTYILISFTMGNETLLLDATAACVAEGTMITLADGTQKKVEDLTLEDKILVFNHETGKYEAGNVWFIHCQDEPARDYTVLNLNFSDDTTVRVIFSHGFFDLDLNRYVYITPGNYTQFVGHRFSAVSGGVDDFLEYEVTLLGGTITQEKIRVFSPVSFYHVNIVTGSLLSVSAFPNGAEGFVNFFEYDEDKKYDSEQMEKDIEKFGLFTYKDFEGYMTKEQFEMTPGKYYKVAIGKGILSYDDIYETFAFLHANGII